MATTTTKKSDNGGISDNDGAGRGNILLGNSLVQLHLNRRDYIQFMLLAMKITCQLTGDIQAGLLQWTVIWCPTEQTG